MTADHTAGHRTRHTARHTTRQTARWLALLGAAVVASSACAQVADAAADPSATAAADPGEFKLTLGHYAYHLRGDGSAGHGDDLNLRYRRGGRTVWLGVYQDASTPRQWRAGWDDQWDVPASVFINAAGPAQLLPSLQVASGGFVGASLALQVGAPFYAQLGIGRTNLRPYANLNFDPNDALMATLGWQGEGGRQAALAVIADDRLGTGQQHHHLTLHWPLQPGLRLTADLLHKQGRGDGGPVNTWGWTLGLDGARWFGRLVHDPKQNFSTQDAWRLSAGRRF